MGEKGIFQKFISWRINHINNKQFIYILSVVIGIVMGFVAFIIKGSVHFIQGILTEGFNRNFHNYLYFLYPAIGISATVLFTKYVIKQHVGHGIPSVLYAISKTWGHIKRHNLFSSIVSSALTVGFGGSVGLEGPTVATGAAFGSNLGRVLKLEYKQILLLLGCACSGAMAAIFKAPIAAVVFVLEVIMLDISLSAIVLLLLSSATASITSYFIFGQNTLYTFDIHEKFVIEDVWYYIVLGVVCGFVSVYFTRIYMFLTNEFEKISRWKIRLLIGVSILGVIIFLFPSLYGEGYQAINMCLEGDYSYLFNNTAYFGLANNFIAIVILLMLVILLKAVATTITFGSGGVGGVFAPSLFVGANTGLLFAKIANYLRIDISVQNFALVGMAGVISGIIHAPLTAIFLIAEITGGYDLFMPLMIVATISYATTKIFTKNSVYTFQLAKRGELITHDRDKSTFILMNIDSLIEKDFESVHPDSTLKDLVAAISVSKRNVFPVLEKDGTMVGIITLNDIRNIMFKYELWDSTYVRNIMYFPEVYVNYDDDLGQIADKIESSGRYNVPVLQDGKYIGFVSRARVFSEYRKLIKHFAEE